MNFRTYEDLANILNNNLHKIPSDVDLVVGIPKSGLMVASMISLYLNLPLSDLDLLLSDSMYASGTTKVKKTWISKPSDARKILIVDDSSISGTALNEAKEKIKKSKYKNKVIFLVVFVNEKTKKITGFRF